eukprot:TRINITY_DN9221_c0_g1_i4.p1 TRINITY_DN9221_c0_g1~~TRINITY_DN9221_c0_g1_i4.p1  ORF type:complete len:433 (-),score=70.69 TRINITY_DN9221_c0_g1_i4:44-1342(-)
MFTPNDPNVPRQYPYRDLNLQLTKKQRNKIGSDYDNYLGDIGSRGIRRLRVFGSPLSPRPSGEIRANAYAKYHNGASLPLLFNDIRAFPYISIDIYVRIYREQVEERPRNSFVLLSFARSSGCVIYVTFAGNPGIRCYKNSLVFASDQVMSWPQDLFDGEFHKVSVLLSTNSGPGFIQVYIDGQLTFDIAREKSWSFINTGESVSFFYDPHFWMYAPLPASLIRASVIGSDNLDRIKEIATRRVLGNWEFQGDADSIEKVPELETVWSDCTAIGTGKFYEGVECTLTAKQNGETLTVPQDVFSLGCSRPRCTISFSPNQPKLADRYRFVYRPNYPDEFVSENVGDPERFPDPARITDGFTTQTISFQLKFSPVVENENGEDEQATEESQETPTEEPVMLEQRVTDSVRYRCEQICCVRVDNFPVESSNDPTF